MDTVDRKCSKKIKNIGMQHGCPMMNCYYMCPMMYPVMCPTTNMCGMNMPMMGMGGMQPHMTQPMSHMMGMGGMQPHMAQPMSHMMGMGGMQSSMMQPMSPMMGMSGMQPSMTQPMGSMMEMGSMQPSMTRPVDTMTDVMQDLTADVTSFNAGLNDSGIYDVKMRTVDISEIED